MMDRQITILTAPGQSLTKSFKLDGTVTPYPLVREFTSTVVNYQTIDHLMEIINQTAEMGGCLLKGSLTKQIERQSRAGLCDASQNTDYLVIDYDSDTGFDSIDELLYTIDPVLKDTDHIFQHSASSGIKSESKIRGHVFVLLTEPVSPTLIKQWMRKVNLTAKKFKAQAKLSRNAMAVCYALDTTVNQNDKLIYVAPPAIEGRADPIDERFVLNRRERRTYTFNATVSSEFNRKQEMALIAELQDASGVEVIKPKYVTTGDLDILTNPGICSVTSVQKGEVFTRINLNGGDSYAYWYPNDNPELLYNFKNEPAVYLKDIAPEYYSQVMKSSANRTIKPLVFRDLTTDRYYNAEYDESTGTVVRCHVVGRRQSLNDFMLNRGLPAPKTIPEWDVVFDPTSSLTVDFLNKRMNTYAPTEYSKLKGDASMTEATWPTIAKVLRHVCVEDKPFQSMLVWIAHIMQFKTKTQTAWLFSGAEGTGKGVMFRHILTPLFGEAHCVMINQENLEDQFNSFFDQNIITFVDEGDIGSMKQAEKVMAKLRTVITEDTLSVRRMRSDLQGGVKNFTNVIIASNKMMAVRLQESDRRWNIPPRQNAKISLSTEEIFTNIPRELKAFAQFIHAMDIKPTDAMQLIESSNRDALLDMSKTVADEFFKAFMTGDLDFFAERLQDQVPIPENGYVAFAAVVDKWMKDAIEGRVSSVIVDELVAVYRYIGANHEMTAKKFGHLTSRYECRPAQKRINGIQRRVFTTQFKDRGYQDWLTRRVHKRPNMPAMDAAPILQ